MYMYIYIHVYIYINYYKCIYVYIYIYIHTYIEIIVPLPEMTHFPGPEVQTDEAESGMLGIRVRMGHLNFTGSQGR